MSNNLEFYDKVRERACLCWFCGNHDLKELHVHHVDFNKKNDEWSNLLVVCNKCHGKLHSLFQRMDLQKRNYVQADLDKKNEVMKKKGVLCLNEIFRTDWSVKE